MYDGKNGSSSQRTCTTAIRASKTHASGGNDRGKLADGMTSDEIQTEYSTVSIVQVDERGKWPTLSRQSEILSREHSQPSDTVSTHTPIRAQYPSKVILIDQNRTRSVVSYIRNRLQGYVITDTGSFIAHERGASTARTRATPDKASGSATTWTRG